MNERDFEFEFQCVFLYIRLSFFVLSLSILRVHVCMCFSVTYTVMLNGPWFNDVLIVVALSFAKRNANLVECLCRIQVCLSTENHQQIDVVNE